MTAFHGAECRTCCWCKSDPSRVISSNCQLPQVAELLWSQATSSRIIIRTNQRAAWPVQRTHGFRDAARNLKWPQSQTWPRETWPRETWPRETWPRETWGSVQVQNKNIVTGCGNRQSTTTAGLQVTITTELLATGRLLLPVGAGSQRSVGRFMPCSGTQAAFRQTSCDTDEDVNRVGGDQSWRRVRWCEHDHVTSAAEVPRHFLSLSAAPGCPPPPSHLDQEEDLMLLSCSAVKHKLWRSSGDESLDSTWSSGLKPASDREDVPAGQRYDDCLAL